MIRKRIVAALKGPSAVPAYAGILAFCVVAATVAAMLMGDKAFYVRALYVALTMIAVGSAVLIIAQPTIWRGMTVLCMTMGAALTSALSIASLDGVSGTEAAYGVLIFVCCFGIISVMGMTGGVFVHGVRR